VTDSIPWKHLVRDAAVIAATLAIWRVDAVLREGAQGTAALAVAALAGVMTAYSGYLVHEWGHLLGALSAGSVVHRPERVFSIFLFQFDSDRNDRRQFLRMSMGGFAASAVSIVLLTLTLPLHAWSGTIAISLVMLGVIATFILEVPVAWQVGRGAPIPRGVAYRSSADAPAATPLR
jgi:hypothetical protein